MSSLETKGLGAECYSWKIMRFVGFDLFMLFILALVLQYYSFIVIKQIPICSVLYTDE